MENAEAVGGQRRQVSTSPLISPVTLVHAGHSSQAGQSVKVIAPTTPAVPASTHTADISLRESLLLALYKTTRLPLPRSARSLALPTDAPGFCPPPDPDPYKSTSMFINVNNAKAESRGKKSQGKRHGPQHRGATAQNPRQLPGQDPEGQREVGVLNTLGTT